MRIIVTGGSGKAGSFVVRELAEAGHEVTNIDVQRPKESLPGNFIHLNLSDAGEVYDAFFQARAEGVCHLAANPSPGGNPRQQVFNNNVQSTYNVFQAAGDTGVKRFVYASSEMATGWLTTNELPPHFPFDETVRVDSPNAYALSKYMGEVIGDAMSVRYSEMPVVSLRINNVITPDTYHWLQERRDSYPQGGSGNFWSYIDVRDVATAFRAAIEGDTKGHEVFLIAASDTCIDVPLGEAITVRYGAEAATRIASGHEPFASVFDCRKIERVLGWTAKHSWRNQA